MIRFSLRTPVTIDGVDYVVAGIDRDVKIKGTLVSLSPVEATKVPYFYSTLPKKRRYFLKPKKEIFMAETLELIGEKEFDGEFVDRFYELSSQAIKSKKFGELGTCFSNRTMTHYQLNQILNS